MKIKKNIVEFRIYISLIVLLLAVLTIVGCGKKPPQAETGDGPPWWKELPLHQREYIAELYRLGIAIGAWQEYQQIYMMHSSGEYSQDSLTADWMRMLDFRRIAADRARIAMRLADDSDVKWLRPFLSRFLESQIPKVGNREGLRHWNDSLAMMKFEYKPPFYLEFTPGIIVSLELSGHEEEIVMWVSNFETRAKVVASTSPPEPREERSPMGKLLRSSWLIPPDGGNVQVKRWLKMAQTEFDDPHWQLGGIPRKP